jgi:hypothetical protein
MQASHAPAPGVTLTPRLARTLAALDAAGGDYAAAAEALGVTPPVVHARVQRLRASGHLPPPRRPARPAKAVADAVADAVPAVVLAAAERLLAGVPREHDWRVVWAWDGYDDVQRDGAALEAARRVVTRTGGQGR